MTRRDELVEKIDNLRNKHGERVGDEITAGSIEEIADFILSRERKMLARIKEPLDYAFNKTDRSAKVDRWKLVADIDDKLEEAIKTISELEGVGDGKSKLG